MYVQLGDYEIPVEIERKKNKNIYFRFKDNGVLYITCNGFVTQKNIIKLIKENEKSLLRMYDVSMKKYERDLSFYYLGNPYTKVFNDNVKEVYFDDDMIYAKNQKQLDKWYKDECLKVFNERIDECIKFFDDIPSFSLKVRTMKTRWGVNNVTRRIITLNSELLKKDVSLIDYVIIHEICHFYEANHSSRFWKQVEKRYPKYKEARKRMKVE
jgi:predicted metal-dependent hydrolase